MNKYELTVIARISDTLEQTKEKIKSVLAKYDVSITSEELWGNKRLAYAIDGENEGYYVFMTLDAAPEAIQKITAEYRLSVDILRFMFVRAKTQKTA